MDVLSGGRLVLGVAVGYVEREFQALGVPFGDRGSRFEDYLAAMRTIWAEGRSAYDGRFVSFEGVQAHPHPLREGHPPIVIGGYAPPVMRRAVREANGWYGWGLSPEETAARLAVILETAERVHRADGLGPLEITITPPGEVDVAAARRYAELGGTALALMLPWQADQRQIGAFFSGVLRPLLQAGLD